MNLRIFLRNRVEHAMATSTADDIATFLHTCTSIVGVDGVILAETAQKTYGQNTVNHRVIIAGAVCAESEVQVIQIVKAAHAHAVGLYPISTGHNWGYGGATPHADHSVILDLSAMNRIISVDSELGVAVV